jgi:hypothetical protein
MHSLFSFCEGNSQHVSYFHAKQAPADAIEAIVPLMPIVLPIVGGALIFLLAFIAVFMA